MTETVAQAAELATAAPRAFRLKTLVHQLRKWTSWSAEVRQP
jgi:hypothetical protein